MTAHGVPTVEWTDPHDAGALVLLLHGWGQTEADMTSLVASLPAGPSYGSVRAPYPQGLSHAWFDSEHSLDETVDWFERWLDDLAPGGRQIILVGFSAGAAFAGGAILHAPDRYSGAALLCGTLPFNAGVITPPGALAGVNVFVAHGTDDRMIQREHLDRTWVYLNEESGAQVRALRFEGGHGWTDPVLVELASWIGEFRFS